VRKKPRRPTGPLERTGVELALEGSNLRAAPAAQRLIVSQQHGCCAKLLLVVVMGKVENIEQQVQALSPEEFAHFRAWFLEFDWTACDRQIEQDARDGKLEGLAQKALRDHMAGKTKPL